MINGIEVIFEEGFVIDKNVEAIINSANNGLLLGRSGAGRIRDITGVLQDPSPEMDEFKQICDDIGPLGRFCWRWLESDAKRYAEEGNPIPVGPTYVQLECLRKIRDNNGEPLKIGDAVITSSGDFAKDPSKPKYIIHVVGMGYEWPEYPINPETGQKNPRPTIEATEKSVTDALVNSFGLLKQYSIRSVALPIMCARVENRGDKIKAYGLTPEKSYQIALDVIRRYGTQLRKVIVCADNESTQTLVRGLK